MKFLLLCVIISGSDWPSPRNPICHSQLSVCYFVPDGCGDSKKIPTLLGILCHLLCNQANQWGILQLQCSNSLLAAELKQNYTSIVPEMTTGASAVIATHSPHVLIYQSKSTSPLQSQEHSLKSAAKVQKSLLIVLKCALFTLQFWHKVPATDW